VIGSKETQRVTPDVVIYRYLQIVAPTECDTEKLCLLLSADADLLTRWLKLLDIQADFDTLQNRLDALDAVEFASLAQAQAWSVLPVVGSARLSSDQWLSVLRAACLAEVLAAHITEESGTTVAEEPQNVRLRALLAISGVQLPQDSKLAQLIEFRGINPALLEDAAAELRIFAVIDGMEVGREVELAEQLLSIKPNDFAGLVEAADKTAENLVSTLAIDTQSDVDWAHRIWLRQQVAIVTESFHRCQSWSELLTLHRLVSRSLFSQAPLVLTQLEEGGAMGQPGSDELSIRFESRTSLVAAAARSGRTVQVNDSTDLAVVDRQLLRLLQSEDAVAVALPNLSLASVLLVASDEDVDVEVAAELYAEEMSQHVARLSAVPGGIEDQQESLLETFRASEYERLREIVHEANNPLSIVHNYLHILELRLQHEPEAVEQLELIGSELRRAGEVFTRARDIPSQTRVEAETPGEVTEIDATTWLARLAELHSGYAAEHGVPLRTNLPGHPLLVLTQQDKLTQIISNLAKNAIEACGPGDEVLLGLRSGIYRGGRVGIEVFVEDTGTGLTDNVLQNLREPKQSSKGGEHQGVGMQLAFKFAQELDGALDVRTEVGQGTTFSLFLPLTVTVSGI
jgi:signal transduction histidine kinase